MNQSSLFAVVPAAGIGKRMNSEIPKQYLKLAGEEILWRSIRRLRETGLLKDVVVAVSEDDEFIHTLPSDLKSFCQIVIGGESRNESVFAALKKLKKRIKDHDFVLVHDAVRPCVRVSDIAQLVNQAKDSDLGSILGVPITDTMKFTDTENNILRTVDRKNMWRALTPQLFKFDKLYESISFTIEQNIQVTDEAQAMEICGHSMRMIHGSPDNIKVTYSEDLAIAEYFLEMQKKVSRR